MEERLKELKSAMNNTVLKNVVFTEKQRLSILAKTEKERHPNIDILQLLQTKKTGYEVSQALIGRGIKNYSNNEGLLYVLLHELESAQYITCIWEEEQKYYQISRKGKKLLVSVEENESLSSIQKELIREGYR